MKWRRRVQAPAALGTVVLTVVLFILHSHVPKASKSWQHKSQPSVPSSAPSSTECLAKRERLLAELGREYEESVDPGTSKGRISCDVPCYADSKRKNRWRVYDGNNRSLTLQFTQEGPAHYPQLHSRLGSDADGLATAVPHEADVPVPYFSIEVHSIKTEPVRLSEVVSGATFVARNCHSRNNREAGVRELQKYVRVDSISGCMRNADWPVEDKKDKVSALRKYAMTLAFENENSPSHVTEKVWQALGAGVLPVYFGAPDIGAFVPEGSIVVANGFDSWESLGMSLQSILANESLYNQYHEWRYLPLSDTFIRKHLYTLTSDDCRACKLLYAQTHNLTWDHDLQDIEWPCCRCGVQPA